MSKQKIIQKLKDDPLMPIRHSCEHVLHTATQILFKNIKKVMGPPIESGFYFDFDPADYKITQENFAELETLMQKIIDANLPFSKKEISEQQAKELFKNNQYKLDNIEGIVQRGEAITVYEMGTSDSEYYDIDLCAGPHAKSTGEIKAFKLLSVAGAYYKGDEKNKMLTRIYGTAFSDKQQLQNHLQQLEEAQKRDHRKLGQELGLFTISDLVGPGLILWKPKGTIIKDQIENWAKQIEEQEGYKRVSTPHIAKAKLYETSGHLPYYKDDMYSPMKIDEEEYYLKGMNCPHHHMIYKSEQKSYRDLPLRLAEYGTVYRYEDSGSLFGLMRVRCICQNDAHIYCTYDQALEEFSKVLKMHEYYYNTLGLTRDDYHIVIGLPDEDKRNKYHGDKELWDKAESIMRQAIKDSGIKCIDDVGGAAFYGPKIDFNIVSSIGRTFTISTCQLDLYMPTRFNLDYVDNKGEKQLCAVIHRAPLGSHERFIGFLIEHFAGAFPVWLAPTQVALIPISDKHLDYAQKINKQLTQQGIRVEIFDKEGTLGNKIREAQGQKIPYMAVFGDKEIESNQISLRLRTGENAGNLTIIELITKIKAKIEAKSLDL